MNDHLNAALAKLQALEWRERTIRRLTHKLEPLGPSDKIKLLKQIDEVIG